MTKSPEIGVVVKAVLSVCWCIILLWAGLLVKYTELYSNIVNDGKK